MIPSVLSHQIQRGVEDFLLTTFPITNPFFAGAIEDLCRMSGAVFKGPYVSIKLPFLKGTSGQRFFSEVTLEDFEPYRHQEIAFERQASPSPRSTLVATGTGSGKTECFLYPILDHCFRHRGEKGIKAILIYPMNALATDQAKRLARSIFHNTDLRGYVTAGLLIGGMQKEAFRAMGEENLITDRDTMRQSPPDILLTNYRMLDYLLVRPLDFGLWKDNGPENLKYLVVDELHTFDGAQAADLACLLRRMKERLKTPPGHLCCIGTSATLGEGDAGFRPEDLLSYARQVFGEPFDADSIVGESVQTPAEFLRGDLVTRFQSPDPGKKEILDPIHYETVEAFLRAQHMAWFDEDPEDYGSDAWRIELSNRLKGHGFFRSLLTILDGRALDVEQILSEIETSLPGFGSLDRHHLMRLLESFLALLSEARIRSGNQLAPLVQLRYQLWLRELRRMVANVGNDRPELAFADDLKPDQLKKSLPVIHCRECGLTGWGGTVKDADKRVVSDLQTFYRHFFAHSSHTRFFFPGEDFSNLDGQTSIQTFVCSSCLRMEWSEKASSCPNCGAVDEQQVPVWLPDTNRRKKAKEGAKGPLYGTHDCPSCGGYNSLTILGSRSASLTSVIIAQLYSSPFNNDKKLLAFSDSVQDASHRAGFFAARTFRFNLRAAIQHIVDEQEESIPFQELTKLFFDKWRARLPEASFIATFLPPDMDWLDDYEELKEKGVLPKGSTFPKQLEKRLDWEIWSEYTFNCRIGRTLEKTGSSVLECREGKLDAALEGLLSQLREKIGVLREIGRETLETFLVGIVIQLKSKGAVEQAELGAYLDSRGNPFLLGKGRGQVHRPNFSPGSRAPVFVTSQPYGRFQTFVRSAGRTTPTWYENWLEKCFAGQSADVGSFAREIYELVVEALVESGVLFQRPVKGSLVWGLSPDLFEVTTAVTQLRCNVCSYRVSTGEKDDKALAGGPCLRYRCRGRLETEPPTEDYYRRLYRSGDVKRIFSTEHTGLLDRETREQIEDGFIHQRRPADPNLLSCTPTLEMGINIGDLSSLALCSIPPKPSNHLQRVGRAGRVDGNAFIVAIANARPHDLFFYFEPEEMIQGQVEPPGCFLNASAVLERQFTGFVFDRWVETGLPKEALPDRLAVVLDAVDRGEETQEIFPWSFLKFYDIQRTEHEERFLELFQDDIEDYARDRIRQFARGSDDVKGLDYRIREGLREVALERKSLRNRVRLLTRRISEKEADPAKGKQHEEDLRELRQEKHALNEVVRSINERHVLEFMTSEGLLPNYAFPEAGVVLRSIIYKGRDRGSGGDDRMQTRVYRYERPAATAIQELAPANSFYAQGRKLVVDQVSLDLSKLEPWRFCSTCTYMALEGTMEPYKTCPKCQNPLWSDEGQKKNMLRMRQVISTSSERASRSHDESDNREPHFYQKNMFVLKENEDITSAFAIDREDVPFGFEFFRKMTIREVNFGEVGGQGSITIAGKEFSDSSFVICRGCGKVQGVRRNLDHAPYCRYRGSEGKARVLEACYLYRDITSEAIRMLLPVATFEVERYIHSFVAALDLGLRKRFRGDPGHLLTTVYDEPMPGSDIRKKFLVLYDGVPGGTGYLKELMRDPDILMDVFQRAYEVMSACACQNDPDKDGCYRCLFAYRGRHDRDNTSRAAALDLLGTILKYRADLKVTDRIDNIRLNSLLESELEGRFIEALRRPEGPKPAESRQIAHQVVNGKQGWYFKVDGASYLIEPQVELGSKDGVSLPSRADFVFYPERPIPGELPIVVFTDGYEFHADPEANPRLGRDTAQRLAILRSGRFRVWSLTWDDVQERFEPKGIPSLALLEPKFDSLQKLLERVDPERVHNWLEVIRETSFETLLLLLGQGRRWNWIQFARCVLASLLTPDCIKDEELSGLWEKLSEPESSRLDPKAVKVSADGTWLLGLSESELTDDILFQGLICADKSSLSTGNLEGIGGICRLYDEGIPLDRGAWKAHWQGFLRWMNLLQFAGTADFVTSRGLAEQLYGDMLLEPWSIRPKFAEEIPEAVQEILAVTDPSVHELVKAVSKAGAPLPEAGYEHLDSTGEIVGTAELGWEKEKVAVILPEQEKEAEPLRRQGWSVFRSAEVTQEPDKVIALLERAKP